MKKIIFLLLAVVASLIVAPAFSQTGTTTSPKIPSQTGNAGKYLKTNGSKLSWANVTAGLSGSLTANYIPYAVSSSSLANSIIFSNAGFVGIGVSTKKNTETVQVYGGLLTRDYIMSMGTSNKISITDTLQNDQIGIYGGSGSPNMQSWGTYLSVNPLGNNVVFPHSSTNIGIGTVSPSAKLDVNGNYSFGSNVGSFLNLFKFGTGGYTSNTYYENGSVAGSSVYYGDRVDHSYDVFRFLNKAGTENVRILANGNFGIGSSNPTAKLHVLQNTVSSGQKGISVNFNTIGEVFYIDDNGNFTYNANYGATFKGSNGLVNIVSNGGANPQLFFKMSDGAFTNGSIRGDNYDLIINANKRVNIDAIFHLNTSTTPVAPAEGDIYQDGTHIYCYLAGAWKQLDN